MCVSYRDISVASKSSLKNENLAKNRIPRFPRGRGAGAQCGYPRPFADSSGWVWFVKGEKVGRIDKIDLSGQSMRSMKSHPASFPIAVAPSAF
jgi:hypothetical protein